MPEDPAPTRRLADWTPPGQDGAFAPPKYPTRLGATYMAKPPAGVTPLTTPTSGFATASLVFGLAAFVTFGVTGIVAVILGHLAVRETKTGQRAGHGMTITGLILGYLSIAGWLIAIALLVTGIAATHGGTSQ